MNEIENYFLAAFESSNQFVKDLETQLISCTNQQTKTSLLAQIQFCKDMTSFVDACWKTLLSYYKVGKIRLCQMKGLPCKCGQCHKMLNGDQDLIQPEHPTGGMNKTTEVEQWLNEVFETKLGRFSDVTFSCWLFFSRTNLETEWIRILKSYKLFVASLVIIPAHILSKADQLEQAIHNISFPVPINI